MVLGQIQSDPARLCVGPLCYRMKRGLDPLHVGEVLTVWQVVVPGVES